jgi:hypothetical protein
MSEVVEKFGDYAGAIWHVLHDHPSLSEPELLTQAKLTESQLYAAIGWLARENKIRKDQTTYNLGDTNLLSFIGKDAGKIWRVLDIWGEVDTMSLARLARITEPEVYTALGWLAKEGKIDGSIKNIEEKKIVIWLK